MPGRHVFENPYPDIEGDDAERNWDSNRRLAELEADGVVAEVLFPNTIPPFFPKTSLMHQPPGASDGDLERRWAGLRAHNRWMADFCGDAPGRRAGICQIMLHDVEGSVSRDPLGGRSRAHRWRATSRSPPGVRCATALCPGL
jgi:hypothetical protein